MRKTLLTLTALAGLVGAGVATTAAAAAPPAAFVQPVQYYYGAGHDGWRERAWRHREWERHHRWEEHRLYHHW